MVQGSVLSVVVREAGSARLEDSERGQGGEGGSTETGTDPGGTGGHDGRLRGAGRRVGGCALGDARDRS